MGGKAEKDVFDGSSNGCSHLYVSSADGVDACKWYEEEIDDDLKWSFALNR